MAEKPINADLLRLKREVLRDRYQYAESISHREIDHMDDDFRKLTKEEVKERKDEAKKALKTLKDLNDSILNL